MFVHKDLEMQYSLGGFFLWWVYIVLPYLFWVVLAWSLFCQTLKWLHPIASWVHLLGMPFSTLSLWGDVYPWWWGVSWMLQNCHVELSISSNVKLSPSLWLSLEPEALIGLLLFLHLLLLYFSYSLKVALRNSCGHLSPTVAFYKVGPPLPSGMNQNWSFLSSGPFHHGKAQQPAPLEDRNKPDTKQAGALIWGLTSLHIPER